MSITKRAAGKINLLLDLTGTFADGYHGIYTVMQSVGIYDTVTVETAPQGLSLTCDIEKSLQQVDGIFPAIPCDARNTAYQAALRFGAYTGIEVRANIHIEKSIPGGAGMAGGSADAAAVLCALNELYRTGLSARQLCRIGAKVGADVPFCILGGTQLCMNIGELMAPMPPLTGYDVVFVKPKCSVSTKAAYDAFDALQNVRHPAKEAAVNAYMRGDMEQFFSLAANVFEQAVEVPGRAEIKAVMRACGCEFTQMTGSGSVVYGLFADPGKARDCVKALTNSGRHVFCVPLTEKGIL